MIDQKQERRQEHKTPNPPIDLQSTMKAAASRTRRTMQPAPTTTTQSAGSSSSSSSAAAASATAASFEAAVAELRGLRAELEKSELRLAEERTRTEFLDTRDPNQLNHFWLESWLEKPLES